MTNGDVYEPTRAEDVVLLYDEPVEPYTVIGIVEGHGVGLTAKAEQEHALTGLRNEAARIGAHGVVLTATGRSELTWAGGESAGDEKVISGKAIRFVQD